MTPFKITAVEDVYNAYVPKQKHALLALRELVFEVAKENDKIGKIEEALKWGQPSFLTKTGSTIRIDKIKDSEKISPHIAMYFICTTHLVDRFSEIYPDTFSYVGGRAIHFEIGAPYDSDALKHCIAMALTYKLKK
ncbi:MAG: hypothetical protein COC17_06645 [Hyphomicrobiales bacterium]|nr:MAG: hypothetical protein COC17_06645 [Hyphomicrobiales bacterium]